MCSGRETGQLRLQLYSLQQNAKIGLLKAVTVLGSTGSIGTSTLDVLRQWPDRFRVFALAAGRNMSLLARQILEFRPEAAVAATPDGIESLAAELTALSLPKTEWPELISGSTALATVATAGSVDIVLSAIVGVAGLEATYEAVRHGKPIALANKETLVAGGELVMDAARESGHRFFPSTASTTERISVSEQASGRMPSS